MNNTYMEDSLQVINRKGETEEISFDEIKNRIKRLANFTNPDYIEYPLSHVNTTQITIETISKLFDGITTRQLDIESAKVCANLESVHPNYGLLGGRILSSDHHKHLKNSNLNTFTDRLRYLNDNLRDFYNSSFVEFVLNNEEQINSILEMERDFLISYFGFKTLEKSYLIRYNDEPIETPQDVFLRVAINIHYRSSHDLETIFEMIKNTYDLTSKGYFTHATPTLFNAGTRFEQMSSCYLLGTEDSLTGIFKTITDTAQISKWAGGIGIHISNIRATNSLINSTNGKSNGILPMLKVYNETARYINQGGKRKGSFAIYLEPWHADIISFLDLKKNTGAETERARDLFTALWIPDEFMRRVEANDDWYIMCPNECPGLNEVYDKEDSKDFTNLYLSYIKQGKYREVLKAQDIFHKIMESQIETGVPYIAFKDNINRKSNQSNIGIVKSSNLCVHGDTKIFTINGYIPISTLKNQKTQIWNGSEWSTVTIRKTGSNKDLIRVNLSNGCYLDCTPEHKFYIQSGFARSKIIEKQAGDLKVNEKLIKFQLPNAIEFNSEDFKEPYTHGLFCGDGTYDYNKARTVKHPKIQLYAQKQELLQYIKHRSYSIAANKKYTTAVLPDDLADKFVVPQNYSINVRLRWFEGYCDGDGSIARNGTNEALQITSIKYDFLMDVKFMLHTLGIESKVSFLRPERQQLLPDGKGGHKLYNCKSQWRILISSSELYKLGLLGFAPKRLKFSMNKPNRNAEQFITIKSIEPSYTNVDTYCFTEPIKHLGIFNGIITGQCAEITEVSSSEEYAVCNLGSIAVNKFIKLDELKKLDTFNIWKRFQNNTSDREELKEIIKSIYDFDHLKEVSYTLTYNLNNIIDHNYYPVPETRKSNLKNRPIGVGVQGLGDIYYMLNIPYNYYAARYIDALIMETIYYGSVSASNYVATINSPYQTYEGSPFSQGILQYDLWNHEQYPKIHDWESLKEKIKISGMANSLLTALMPTATTSQILGNNECFEPYSSNIYKRTTLAGEFQVVNRHLVNILLERGLWNEKLRSGIVSLDGSIQNINISSDNPNYEDFEYLKQVYKTVWEVKQKDIIDHAIARSPYVDQSQSMNLFFAKPDFKSLFSAIMYGWKNGLKTGCYYLRSKPATEAAKFSIDVSENKTESEQECSMCSA